MLNEFIFEDFNQAMEVHKEIFQIIREKGYLSYRKLYSLITKKEEKEVDNLLNLDIYDKHGWTNLFECKIDPTDDGKWILKMPELKNIESRIIFKNEERKNNNE
jgi:hypothetical protein